MRKNTITGSSCNSQFRLGFRFWRLGGFESAINEKLGSITAYCAVESLDFLADVAGLARLTNSKLSRKIKTINHRMKSDGDRAVVGPSAFIPQIKAATVF